MAKGCYLTFSDASQGTLFLHWCVTVQIYFCRAAAHLSRVVGRRLVVYNAHRSEAPVAGALAFFEPRKTVPAFKYKSNGGRSELIREMSGGTGERIKRFYQRAHLFTAPSIAIDVASARWRTRRLLHGNLPVRQARQVLRRGARLLRTWYVAVCGNRADRRIKERLQRRPRLHERARRQPGIRHGGRRRARRERRLRGVDVLAGVFHLHGQQGGQRARDISRHMVTPRGIVVAPAIRRDFYGRAAPPVINQARRRH